MWRLGDKGDIGAGSGQVHTKPGSDGPGTVYYNLHNFYCK